MLLPRYDYLEDENVSECEDEYALDVVAKKFEAVTWWHWRSHQHRNNFEI